MLAPGSPKAVNTMSLYFSVTLMMHVPKTAKKCPIKGINLGYFHACLERCALPRRLEAMQKGEGHGVSTGEKNLIA